MDQASGIVRTIRFRRLIDLVTNRTLLYSSATVERVEISLCSAGRQGALITESLRRGGLAQLFFAQGVSKFSFGKEFAE